MAKCAFVLLLLLGAHAHAQREDPDTEVARRLYESGAGHYDAREYPQAIADFERARALKPLPALDYNIGRCYDRMGNFEKALAAYQRYVGARPEPKDAAEVRARMVVLSARVVPPPPTTKKSEPLVDATPPPPKKRRAWVLPVAIVGAVAVVGLAVGLGVGLGTSSGPADPTPTLGAIHWR